MHLHLPVKPDLERPAFFHCRSVEKPLHLTDANDELGSTLKCECTSSSVKIPDNMWFVHEGGGSNMLL